MEDLTFGEQVKIILGRKGMTIKELAETIEKETGKKTDRYPYPTGKGRREAPYGAGQHTV